MLYVQLIDVSLLLCILISLQKFIQLIAQTYKNMCFHFKIITTLAMNETSIEKWMIQKYTLQYNDTHDLITIYLVRQKRLHFDKN